MTTNYAVILLLSVLSFLNVFFRLFLTLINYWELNIKIKVDIPILPNYLRYLFLSYSIISLYMSFYYASLKPFYLFSFVSGIIGCYKLYFLFSKNPDIFSVTNLRDLKTDFKAQLIHKRKMFGSARRIAGECSPLFYKFCGVSVFGFGYGEFGTEYNNNRIREELDGKKDIVKIPNFMLKTDAAYMGGRAIGKEGVHTGVNMVYYGMNVLESVWDKTPTPDYASVNHSNNPTGLPAVKRNAISDNLAYQYEEATRRNDVEKMKQCRDYRLRDHHIGFSLLREDGKNLTKEELRIYKDIAKFSPYGFRGGMGK